MKLERKMVRVLGMGVLAFVCACGDDGDARDEKSFEIAFAAKFGDREFRCGETYDGVGSTEAEYRASDFRFFVHAVHLIEEDGTERALALTPDERWQSDTVALLDFEDKTSTCSEQGSTGTNTTVRGTAPDRTYTGLRFTLGVPETLNHGDVAAQPAPLDVSGMFWVWRDGYKFVRVDGTSSGNLFFVHLGSTECGAKEDPAMAAPKSPCKQPNRPTIRLRDFDPETGQVVADFASLVAETDVTQNEEGTAPGCMSERADGDCETILAGLGIGDASKQTFFRVE